ncbi:hypothetical protein niasHT_039371 [Heterodera trifolii]|uniref:Peptidase M16 N-terminal domain-containing protein n=1 Tax=Heterodera trifolii TaxID=157864 RepID=A0ABD2I212_9BILA
MHFKSNSFLIAEKFKITVYSSERSRLRVFIADTPGPLVDGRITFLTESNTNEGLAHSLEHLCFMGTQKYLQKGMLDRIANSCMANGTNAYTDQHHTCYELTTVGSTGFLKVILVLLEHLLQPLLTPAHYVTEIYHIDGDGQEGGVIYSEMQSRHLETDFMVEAKRKELFYPMAPSHRVMPDGMSTSTNVVANLSDEFVDKFNFATILHYVPSDFFDVNIVFDTEAIPKDLLMFLPLWFQLIDHSPVIVDGRKQSCKIIAKQATRDLVSHSVSVGISGHYDRFVCFRLRTVAHNACNLAKWEKTYIHDLFFREHRLVIAAKNLSKSAAAAKRNGLAVCQFMSSAISQDDTTYFHDNLELEKFQEGIVEAVQKNGRGKQVIDELEQLRNRVLAAPMNVHFCGDPSKIMITADQLADQWSFFEQIQKSELFKCPVGYGDSLASPGQSCAILMGSLSTAFLLQKIRFNKDWAERDTMLTLLLGKSRCVIKFFLTKDF